MTANDEHFMNLALQQAEKGLGFTSPNPLVGAVIVKNNQILAQNFHKKDGENHAEVNAIQDVNPKDLNGATLYVTLEPCSHQGRTPPCTEAIIKVGINRVVIANTDPDVRVNGKGIEILKKAGIEITTGICEEKGKQLNAIYFFNKINERPYFVLKAALSLDGKIATYTGNSKWLSSETCRDLSHQLRLKLKAIAIGANTVRQDKPQLNCRLPGYEQKPIDKLIFTHYKDPENDILLTSFASNPGHAYFIDDGISFSRDNLINFCNEKQIDSVLIEGGAEVYSWFLSENLVDRLFLFYRPAFIGKDGLNLDQTKGLILINQLKDFKIVKTSIIDNNFLVDLTIGEPLPLIDLSIFENQK